VYLGLRGNKIGDAAILHLTKLPRLTGLHLGETGITDKGLEALAAFGQLQKLWLHDTRITDASVPCLAGLRKLQSLYLHRTGLTVEGVRGLQKALPKCRIFYRSATVPE